MAASASSSAVAASGTAAAVPSPSPSIHSASEIERALSSLHESIDSLTRQHGLPRPPLLLAVAKTKPISSVQGAYAAGCRHFGENYVKELVEKSNSPQLSSTACPGIAWHFIGHLQSNKVRMVVGRVPNLAMVESVDSVRLATELNKAVGNLVPRRDGPLPVLIQVNTSGEASKFGCAPEAAIDLFGHVLTNCPLLDPRGLMTIGRLADEPQPDCFDLLVKLRQQICEKFAAPTDATAASSTGAAAAVASFSSPSPRFVDPSRFEMSMGMSGDYVPALERGATILRIGTTIFGERDVSKMEPPPRTPSPSARGSDGNEDPSTAASTQ